MNTFDCPDEDWAHFTANTPSVTKANPEDPTKQPLNPAKAFINPGKFGTIPARLFAIDEMWEIFFGVRPCKKVLGQLLPSQEANREMPCCRRS